MAEIDELHAGNRGEIQRDILAAALKYASMGWRVIPIHTPTPIGCSCTANGKCKNKPGKHPKTKNGLKDGTTDQAKIREWWNKWRDANIGIVTGAESGLVVLDVDGKEGQDSLDALERQCGKLPNTVEVLTGGGGRHFYFKHPGRRVKTCAGKIARGLDIRGDGGYVVAPPSIHASGKNYEWESDSLAGELSLSSLPSWILDRISGRTDGKGNGNATGWIATAIAKLHEGNRNATFAKIIGRLHHNGWKAEDILKLLIPHAQKHNFSLEELRKEIEGICMRYPAEENELSDDYGRQRKISVAKQVLSLVEAEKLEFFHDQYKEPHCVPPGSAGYAIPLRSKTFRQWLVQLAWKKLGQAVSRESLQTAIQVLEGKALFDCPRKELHVRVGWQNGVVYYDLSNGQVVQIDADGWIIQEKTPILFRRMSHQKHQVVPAENGNLTRFLDFVNLPGQAQKDGRGLLLLVWLVVAFIPGFPHPPLVVHGPQGSAKSTLFGMLKELLDPSSLRVLAPTDSLREFVIQAAHHWFVPLDNFSSLPDWMSDALCRACTGDGFSKRELFTDVDEVILTFQRIVGLNGINLVVDKPDLLDRSLLLGLGRITEEHRREENKVWEQFHQAKSELLASIFTAVSKTLANYPYVQLSSLPRMADFARWGVAASQALGYGQEAFLSAYRQALTGQHHEAITASLVAQSIVHFMEDQDNWGGTPSEFLAELNRVAEQLQIDTRSKKWPKDPNWVWRRLGEAKTNLEAIGLIIERGEGIKRYITIQKRPESGVDTAGAANSVIVNTPASTA